MEMSGRLVLKQAIRGISQRSATDSTATVPRIVAVALPCPGDVGRDGLDLTEAGPAAVDAVDAAPVVVEQTREARGTTVVIEQAGSPVPANVTDNGTRA